jgi:sigma-B regulation protein RsbU (phosphoserine phosphatase)
MAPPSFLTGVMGNLAAGRVMLLCLYGFLTLGLISLAANFLASDEQARRKIRVLFLGTAVGLSPALLAGAAADLSGFQQPMWLNLASAMALFAFPLSFAYAVVKHRVLEIPALLRTSARYLLVMRGFTLTLGLASIGVTLLFASWAPAYFAPVVETAQPAAVAAGAVFGTLMLWSGSRVHRRVRGRIDRAFFRSAYDARVILEDLVARTPAVTDRAQLARLIRSHVTKAPQPASLAVFVRDGERLATMPDDLSCPVESLPAGTPLLLDLAARKHPREFAASPEDPAAAALSQLDPDCLVPMLGPGSRLEGLLVLGPRLADEPYSGEDKRLLASVAGHAGTALENLRLAGEIAERIDAKRRAAREMEIAKEVQSRLLPQEPPRIGTLEVAAGCVQARQVGGDSFDFLELGEDRTGFVLADVCGKGVHAALLMANLQAYLRSQSSAIPDDPARLLSNVNRMLFKSTAAQHYATMFFGVYDDEARTLTYAKLRAQSSALVPPRRPYRTFDLHRHRGRFVRKLGLYSEPHRARARRFAGDFQRRHSRGLPPRRNRVSARTA